MCNRCITINAECIVRYLTIKKQQALSGVKWTLCLSAGRLVFPLLGAANVGGITTLVRPEIKRSRPTCNYL